MVCDVRLWQIRDTPEFIVSASLQTLAENNQSQLNLFSGIIER
jgi:hypothetical protein